MRMPDIRNAKSLVIMAITLSENAFPRYPCKGTFTYDVASKFCGQTRLIAAAWQTGGEGVQKSHVFTDATSYVNGR